MKQKNQFIFLEHTADIKFKSFGLSIEEVFENSALAFSSYVASDSKIKSKKSKKFSIESDNLESLLYNFLDELIFLLDAQDFIVSSAKVKIKGMKLTASLKGDSTKKYNLNHVKAATYAEMYIKKNSKDSKSWEAQVVLDV